MEGRGFSELYRNTSEELFIRTMMENSIAMPAPTIDMLSFRNLSQSFRTDSEELFKTWLTCGENNGSSPTMAANRTRQASRRISTEIAGLPNQQQAGTQKRKGEDALLPQTNSSANEPSSGLNQQNTAGKEMQAANFYLAKAWFHSSQPMTRSRSSELRSSQLGVENLQTVSGNGIETFKQEFGNTNGFTDLPTRYEMPNQLSSFVSPSNSSSSTFEAQNVDAADKISSVVSMLKGTLERKKLSGHCHTSIEALEDSSAGIYGAHEVLCNSSLNHMLGGHVYEKHEALQDASFFQVNDTGVFQATGGSLDAKLDDAMAPTSLIQMGAPSQELSQSESSVVPLVISTGFDICDGSSNTYQAQNGRSTENGSSTRGNRDIFTLLVDIKLWSLESNHDN
nr:protein CYCLOPS-like [Ipomoea batatas]